MIDSIDILEDLLADGEQGALFLEPRETFDRAILGIAERAGGLTVVAYDTDLCIQALMDADGMDRNEAIDFFEFNTKAAWAGDGTPVFVERVVRIK